MALGSGSSSKSLIIKLPEFCSLMKPGNVGVAEATARLSGYISGQKAKAWIVKDLGLEPVGRPFLNCPQNYGLHRKVRKLIFDVATLI
ncbi:MAG: hypothetical protein GVY26_07335 [Bacteroidetes bacterium]|jgi:hypothetical protein|nr:hypothetical protein [Bacteroidota bacterium]